MKINAPISALISVSCFGYILGEIRTIYDIYHKFTTNIQLLEMADILSIFLMGIAITGFIITGIYALIKTVDTHKVLKEIRQRNPMNLEEIINNLMKQKDNCQSTSTR